MGLERKVDRLRQDIGGIQNTLKKKRIAHVMIIKNNQ